MPGQSAVDQLRPALPSPSPPCPSRAGLNSACHSLYGRWPANSDRHSGGVVPIVRSQTKSGFSLTDAVQTIKCFGLRYRETSLADARLFVVLALRANLIHLFSCRAWAVENWLAIVANGVGIFCFDIETIKVS